MTVENRTEAVQAYRTFLLIGRFLTSRELTYLADGIREDDPRLLQAQTVFGPVKGPCQGACALCYGHMRLYPHLSERDVDMRFVEVQDAFKEAHPDTASNFGRFLTWYDHANREEIKTVLLPAIDKLIAEKGK